MVLPPFLSLLKNKAKQDKKNMEKMPLGEDFLKTTLGVDCYWSITQPNLTNTVIIASIQIWMS